MEPVYSYKKGEGWVLGYSGYTFEHNGNRITVEERTPQAGEMFYYAHKAGYGSSFVVNEAADLQKFAEVLISMSSIQNYNAALLEAGRERSWHIGDPNYLHVVVKIERIT